MKKKKLFLGILVAGASIITLASCGGKKKPTSSAPITDPATSTPVVTTSDNPVTDTTPITVVPTTDPITSVPVTDPVTSDPITDPVIVSTDTDPVTSTDPVLNVYNVNFYVGEEKIKEQSVNEGETIGSLPSTDDFESSVNALYSISYEFEGWYDENNIEYTSSSIPTTDVNLYAKFSTKTVKLNTMSALSYTNVTDLINENNLNDVIEFEEREILTLFNVVTKSGSESFEVFSYYIKNGNVDYVGEEKNNNLYILMPSGKLEETVIYLPFVIKKLKEYNIKFDLLFNGTKFQLTADTIDYKLSYDINGYITNLGDFEAIYNNANNNKPDISELDIKKSANYYELYTKSNPLTKYTYEYVKDKWISNTDIEDINIILESLTISAYDLPKFYSKALGLSLKSMYKANNNYYLIFEYKEFNYKVQVDKFGYIRTIIVESNKTGNTETFYANPVFAEAIPVKPIQFVEDVFTASGLKAGIVDVAITSKSGNSNIQYVRYNGEVIYDNTALYAKEVSEPFIADNLNAMMTTGLKNNAKFYLDLTEGKYIVTFTASKTNVVLKFDYENGQLVETIINTQLAEINAKVTSYEMGETAKVTFNSKIDIDPVYVIKGNLLNYIPDDIYVEDSTGVRETLVFEGYYLDELLNIPFDYETILIKGDIELFVKASTKIQYPVRFHMNMENPDEYIIVYQDKDSEVVPPEIDEKWYMFDGWYTDATYTKPANFTNIAKDYYAKAYPLTYAKLEVFGEGNLEVIDKEHVLPNVSSTEFVQAGCFEILGNLYRTEDILTFSTQIANKTMIKFSVLGGTSFAYGAEAKENIAASLFYKIEEIRPGDYLKSKVYYVYNGELVQANDGEIAQEGVDYYELIISTTPNSGQTVIRETLKAGTYIVMQLGDANLLGLRFGI